MHSENNCILDEIANRDLIEGRDISEKKEIINIKDLLIDFPNYSKNSFEEYNNNF